MQTEVKYLDITDLHKPIVFELLNALCEFGIETSYEDSYTDTVEHDNKILLDIHYILSDIDSKIIILKEDKEVIGFSIVSKDKLFRLDEGMGILVKFYVRKQYRGTTAGRELAAATMAWFNDSGVKNSFCTATGNIGISNTMFENLFRKFNYEPIGKCLTRKHE